MERKQKRGRRRTSEGEQKEEVGRGWRNKSKKREVRKEEDSQGKKNWTEVWHAVQ